MVFYKRAAYLENGKSIFLVSEYWNITFDWTILLRLMTLSDLKWPRYLNPSSFKRATMGQIGIQNYTATLKKKRSLLKCSLKLVNATIWEKLFPSRNSLLETKQLLFQTFPCISKNWKNYSGGLLLKTQPVYPQNSI